MKRRTVLKHLALVGSAAMLSLHSQRLLAAGQEATAIVTEEAVPESPDRPERRRRPHRRRRYWLRRERELARWRRRRRTYRPGTRLYWWRHR